MILSDKVYSILKWGLMILTPALITLIAGLGELYNFDTTLIIGTIGLVATFLGAITGISNNNFIKAQKYITTGTIDDRDLVEENGTLEGDEE